LITGGRSRSRSRGERAVVSGTGWGNNKGRRKLREKTEAELRIEKRRELGKRFPSSIDELVEIASRSKKLPKVIPPKMPENAGDGDEYSFGLTTSPTRLLD
jgi:hypothetical protein